MIVRCRVARQRKVAPPMSSAFDLDLAGVPREDELIRLPSAVSSHWEYRVERVIWTVATPPVVAHLILALPYQGDPEWIGS